MYYFIVNPVSGKGKAATAVPVIEKRMGESGQDYIILYTESDNDFDRIAGLINVDKAQAVVCIGGDGTIQQYIGLTVGRDVPFGVIPVGSGNDFLYSLQEAVDRAGLKPGAAEDAAASAVQDGANDHPAGDVSYTGKFPSFEDKVLFFTNKVLEGATIPVDAVSVNGAHHILNIAGTGIDIEVLKSALPLKKYLGGGAYFLSLMKNAATYRAEEITLTVDGYTEKDRYLLLAICNGAYYGGHMRVAPPAAIDDGFITLCIVRKMPRLKLMALFPSVKPGRHVRFKEVSFTNCLSVKLEFEGTRTINFDGNLPEFESPLVFELLRGAVRFIM